MQKFLRAVLISMPIVAITIIGLFFQNCSKVAVSDVPNSPDQLTLQGSPVEQVAQLVTACESAKERKQISTSRVSVKFEDPGKACSWGANQNLNILDGYVRARVEQYQQVQIPSGATVCQVRMVNTDVQNFRYDDNIILTMNNFILASTTDFSKYFSSTNGYYSYDWSKIVEKQAQNGAQDTVLSRQYCAGADNGLASCAFPITETTGSVTLSFNERVVQNILGMTNPSKVELGMITTGDNDSTDCQHVPINLQVDIDYF